MGLALRVLLGATNFQMQRGEHNNSRYSSAVPISRVNGRRGTDLSQARCVTCTAVQGLRTTEATRLGATDTYHAREMYCCGCCGCCLVLLAVWSCVVAESRRGKNKSADVAQRAKDRSG